jgi:hypothetical protein
VIANIINREVTDYLKPIELLEKAGDAYGVQMAIEARKKLYAKIPVYEE